MAQAFEDLQVWQKARMLTQWVYTITKSGPLSADFGLKDQLQRSSVSVMANIAEGFERGGRNEYRHFLTIAKGSCGEVRCLLYIVMDNGYYSEPEIQKIQAEAIQVSKMLSALIAKLKAQS